ncbi:hypothetical protein [Pontibacillus marinus]|nr:hypothetical protein [Pontibacillus marinus]
MLLNSLFSFSLFLILTFSLLPMIHTVYKEQMILDERRFWLHTLQDELRFRDELISLPTVIELDRHEQVARVTFQYKSTLIEGCIEWTNERGTEERECLYKKP